MPIPRSNHRSIPSPTLGDPYNVEHPRGPCACLRMTPALTGGVPIRRLIPPFPADPHPCAGRFIGRRFEPPERGRWPVRARPAGAPFLPVQPSATGIQTMIGKTIKFPAWRTSAVARGTHSSGKRPAVFVRRKKNQVESIVPGPTRLRHAPKSSVSAHYSRRRYQGFASHWLTSVPPPVFAQTVVFVNAGERPCGLIPSPRLPPATRSPPPAKSAAGHATNAPARGRGLKLIRGCKR